MPHIFLNHLGFLCQARKQVLVEGSNCTTFEIQDMRLSEKESLDGHENWKTIFRGQLKKLRTDMGEFLSGDFSDLTTPGLYRIVLPDLSAHSYHFFINDGTFWQMPGLLLDFVHHRRSGNFENEWRGPSHLDDAVRSDTREQIDCVGGWYDAGDFRKWMSMTMLPALGFLDLFERKNWKRNLFHEEEVSDNDLITETVWGIRFILKMCDPETGMIYEEIGAGGEARRTEGMNWWYENHSGCYADNSENRETDNIPGSGDERTVRVEYNPIVQYTNLVILLRAANVLDDVDMTLANDCRTAAKRAWDFVQAKKPTDKKHGWTSIRSWQLCAALEMRRSSLIDDTPLQTIIEELLELFSENTGFWYMTSEKADSYRGVLHSAQPVIALARLIEYFPSSPHKARAVDVLRQCLENYIKPMAGTNPFGIMPYGLFAKEATKDDRYREWKMGWKYRFFMPDNSPQKINHGLGGHWTSWSHALAYAGHVLGIDEMKHMAWNQLYWLLGNNFKNSCVVSGLGYNNPMPHSRFYGTIIGGFCVGPIGDLDDSMSLDMEARAQWNTTEYWNVPVANSLMALSILLPGYAERKNKV